MATEITYGTLQKFSERDQFAEYNENLVLIIECCSQSNYCTTE